MITGGTGNITVTRVYAGSGSLVTGGASNISTAVTHTGSGGLVTGGDAGDAEFFTSVSISRGGVFYKGRRGIRFEYAPPHKEITPMEYWKRIEKAIEDAKQRERKLYKHKASGGLLNSLKGKTKIALILCDLPDSKVIVHSNFQVDDTIKLEISRLFNNDMTQDEIIALDDDFIMNDLLNRGDYELKTGDKSRYRYRGKTAGGQAGVSFVSGGGAMVSHFDRAKDQKRTEDDDLLLGDTRKKSREEEDLELLGLLD